MAATDRETKMPCLFNTRPGILTIVTLLASVLMAAHPVGAQTLKAVKERGTLNCGVSQGLLGFSSMDDTIHGPVLTWIFAAPWRLPSSTIRRK